MIQLSHNGHKMMDRIEGSKIPIVAAIHGSCLGGGLEVALACHARVASSSPKTVLGLPEGLPGKSLFFSSFFPTFIQAHVLIVVPL